MVYNMPNMNKAGKRYKKTTNESAIVMSKPEYQKTRDPRKRFNSQAEWDKFFKFVDTIKARMPEKDHVELQKIIEDEVKAVRAEETTTSIKQEH
jgi:hypothetical protein